MKANTVQANDRDCPDGHRVDVGVSPMIVAPEDGAYILVRCASCGIGGRIVVDHDQVSWGEFR